VAVFGIPNELGGNTEEVQEEEEQGEQEQEE
jgi:hypothetical protein